jgi:hypothetical protein
MGATIGEIAGTRISMKPVVSLRNISNAHILQNQGLIKVKSVIYSVIVGIVRMRGTVVT